MEKNVVPTITESELSKVGSNLLNKEQLAFLFAPTPESHVYKRKAKGGGYWTYVTGAYVKKVLNLMFGWNWDFEILDEMVKLEIKQVIVKGRLVCRTGTGTIIKTQYGRQDIKFKKEPENVDGVSKRLPLDLGNDMKGAATDCLKKCASEFGIAGDIYAPNEYKQIDIIEDPEPRELGELSRLVKNANNIDELQLLWSSFSEDEKKIATIVMELKRDELND